MVRPPDDRLTKALIASEGVVTLRLLCEAGVPLGAADAFLRASRRSRRVLPGVHVAHLGSLSDRELDLAACRYAGPQAILTGARALRHHGVSAAPANRERHMLLPTGLERRSTGFVVVDTTGRWPAIDEKAGIRLAGPARAALDFARRATDASAVRAVLSEVIRERKATVQELTSELRDGPTRGSKFARQALDGLRAGARSVAELQARELISASSRIPAPTYNQHLYDESGLWVCCADIWWRGVVGQVQSKRYHFVLDKWEDDQGQATRLAAYNTLVLPIVPRRLYKDWPQLEAEIASAVESAAKNACRLRPGPPPPWWGSRMG